MKEITIITSDTRDIKKPSNRFILSIIEELYKNGIRVTVFSKLFSNNFPAYITRKRINTIFLKRSSKIIANHSYDAEAIIAIDFPTNIIASMVKNRLLKKGHTNIPVIVWYAFDFPSHLYFYNKKNQNIFLKNTFTKLDLNHTPNMDIIISGSKKIKDNISYIHPKVKNIEIIYPCFSPYIINKAKNSSEDKENYFLLFFKENVDNIYKCTVAYYEYLKQTTLNPYHLKIIGFNNDLKKHIEMLGLENYVEIIASQEENDIIKLIEKAYAIIIYDISDSFNTEFLASWYYKTLTIIDASNPASEIAFDNVNALIYNSQNPISLTNALKIATVNKDLYYSIISQAYDMLHFNTSKCTQLILKAINVFQNDSTN